MAGSILFLPTVQVLLEIEYSGKTEFGNRPEHEKEPGLLCGE